MTTGQPIPTNHQVFRIDLILSNFSMVNPLGLAPIVFWLGSIAHVLPGNALFNQLFFLAQHHPKSPRKSMRVSIMVRLFPKFFQAPKIPPFFQCSSHFSPARHQRCPRPQPGRNVPGCRWGLPALEAPHIWKFQEFPLIVYTSI